MNIGEVFLKLGFDVDETTIKGFADKISNLQKDMLKLSGVAAGALFGLESFTRGSIDTATALENLRDATGENVEAVQRWMSAGHLANIALSYDAVRGSIEGVNSALQRAVAFGENRNIFGKMDIAPMGAGGRAKVGTDFLQEILENWGVISSRYKEFGGTQGLLNDLQALGIDRGMLQVLSGGQTQFGIDASKYAVVASDIEKNKKLGQDIENLTIKIKSLKDAIVADWAEPIGKALDQVVPEFNKIALGFASINSTVKSTAGVIAAGLTLAFSPLFAAATAVGLIGIGLQNLGIMEQKGREWSFANIAEGTQNILEDAGLFIQRLPGETVQEAQMRVMNQSVNQGSQSKVINQTNNITAYGSNDPKETAENIQEAIKGTIQQFPDVY
ncbi:MAG: hypothetical protein KAJ40_09050 [Alphaproteobacteria bacterium]|nr:hypothetical protein [Alphaproteobacteria bacterium]